MQAKLKFCCAQVLRSLQQMHMVKATSCSAYLQQENAVIVWNTDLSLLPAVIGMVHACLKAGQTPNAAAARAVPMQAQSSTANINKGHAHGGHAHHTWRVPAMAASMLVAACACFVALAIMVRSPFPCPKSVRFSGTHLPSYGEGDSVCTVLYTINAYCYSHIHNSG